MSDGYHGVCAPDVPEAVRRGLDGAGPEPASVLLAAIVAVLAGVAGVAVLASGARPVGASAAVFGAAAGGGGLLVALVAAVLAVRGAVRLRRARAAERTGRYVSARALADLAERDPAAAALVARTQETVRRIRASPGALAAALDEAALRRIEWSVAEAALRLADDAERERLAAEVARLDELVRTAAELDVPRPSGAEPSVARLTDDLDRASLIATEIRRFAGSDRKSTD
ncbi:MAG TPA: hypothetical protein VGN37_02375 [Actinocatenispora sp.]